MNFNDYVENIPLVSIFYARFDKDKGAIYDYIYPDDSFPNDLRKFCKKLLIPKEPLMGKVLTMRTTITVQGQLFHYKVVTCPETIAGDKYERFKFLFNFGFILRWGSERGETEPNSDYFRSSPFAPLVKKLAQDMVNIEIEEEWLSKAHLYNKSHIPELLAEMYTGLRARGHVNIPLGSNQSNEIYLRVFPPQDKPDEVRVHHVPILIDGKINRVEYADLTVQEMISRIDGVNHIKKICGEHHRDLTPQIACLTIRDLCFAGVCRLDRIFKYSNRYRTTEKLNNLYQSFISKSTIYEESEAAELMRSSEPYSHEPRWRRESNPSKVTPKITFHDIFRFLCALGDRPKLRRRHLTSIIPESDSPELYNSPDSNDSVSGSTMIEDYPTDTSDDEDDDHPTLADVLRFHQSIVERCDVRKLIRHAMMKEYIYLVEEYPALVLHTKKNGSDDGESEKVTAYDGKIDLLTSAFSTDEICAHLNLSPGLLKQEFDKIFHDRVTYFFK